MYRKKLEVRLLLEAVYTLSGYDFRKYNQQSILRRIEHRMRLNNFSSISQLTEAIIYDKEVLKVLLNDFSINVTEMFRDPSFFRAFREEIIPQLKQLDKIRREKDLSYKISVDGGVNEKTIQAVIDSGVDIIVSGSAFFSGALLWK